VAQWVRQLDFPTTHTSLSPIRRGFVPTFVNYKNGCTRLTAASDKAYQLLAHGRWFSPPSSTTKTGRHDIAEILLKVVLNTIKIKSNQISSILYCRDMSCFGSRIGDLSQSKLNISSHTCTPHCFVNVS
jgi:hypothetical protein